MKIIKVISEHKSTKRASRLRSDGEGGTHVESERDRYHSKVGFIQAVVEGTGGYLYTVHIPDPRSKKKEEVANV